MIRRFFVVAIFLTMFAGCASAPDEKKAKGKSSKEASTKYLYVYCPECLSEYPYRPQLAGKSCPECKKGSMTPSRTSVRDGGDGPPVPFWARWLATIVIFAVIAQVGVLSFLYWRRKRAEALAKEESATLRCRCPGCKRKFAYPKQKAGQSAICPRCKKTFDLPKPAAE